MSETRRQRDAEGLLLLATFACGIGWLVVTVLWIDAATSVGGERPAWHNPAASGCGVLAFLMAGYVTVQRWRRRHEEHASRAALALPAVMALMGGVAATLTISEWIW